MIAVAPVAQWAKSMLEPALPRLSTPAEVSNWVSKKSVALVLFAADYTSPEVEMLHGVAAAMSSDAGNPPFALSTTSPSAAGWVCSLRSARCSRRRSSPSSKHDEGHSVLLPSESEPLTHARMLRFAQAAALPAVLTYAAGKPKRRSSSPCAAPSALLSLDSPETRRARCARERRQGAQG